METYNRDRHVKGVESYDAQIETSTGRDFTVGLALGLFVGVVGGLFIAPKSGDALRDDIKKVQDSMVRVTDLQYQKNSMKKSAMLNRWLKTKKLKWMKNHE